MLQDNSKFRLDFVGIGFTKCGSTWIYKLLDEHPEICVSKTKETNFFHLNKDLLENKKKLKSYENYYWHCEKGQVRGEFSPGYANKEVALNQIKDLYPDIKIIVALRNPVDRVISSFFFRNRFDKQITERDPDSALREKYENVDGSMYSRPLRKWLKHFPRERIFVMVLEDLASSPEEKTKELFSFLGVDSDFTPASLNKKVNPAHTYHFPSFQKLLKVSHRAIKKRPGLSKTLKKIKPLYNFKEKLNKGNHKVYKKPEVTPESRKFLKDKFQNEVVELEKLLNLDLSSWK